MKFPDPLIRGTLIKRYKRFLADVTLDDGTKITAHCANSGSMLSVNAPGSEVWLSPARNPNRKLRYTWELIRVADALVGINTQHPNAITAEAIEEGLIPELAGQESLRREVKYGKNSRIDILLEGGGKPDCYVEVKNVTLRRDSGPDRLAEFPDAVTSRGAKHLAELADMVTAGHRAVMMYLVQRGDCETFRLAEDIDPAYARAFAAARAGGVEALCYACRVDPTEIRIERPIPLEI
ncbi:MAG: DNA/RNA nuclease SfsA [Rhodospirillales bacterium]|nr:DNA/RNA nuclease SfsA [Rhodospirillales bacterium]